MRDEPLAGIRGQAEALLYSEPCRLCFLRLEYDGVGCAGKVTSTDEPAHVVGPVYHRDERCPTDVPIDVVEYYLDLYDDAVRGVNPSDALDGAVVAARLVIDKTRATFSAYDGQGSSIFYCYDVVENRLEPEVGE